MTSVKWHRHACPQCFREWDCGGVKCVRMKGRFCPYGELCHVRGDGVWRVSPRLIRKGRGVGELFETRGVETESPSAMKDLWPDADIREGA